MSIMDFFKNAESAPQDKQASAGNNGNNNGNLNSSPKTEDDNGKVPGTALKEENPLDAYKKMFDNAANGSEIQAPSFKIDPKILSDVSGKMDFTRNINPETLQKATSGDVSALMDIIKSVGQNSYRAAIEHGTSLTDTFLTQRGEYESKNLAKGVRSQLTSNELSSAPNYSHPVVKAELNRIASQFAAANPDSSPQEVAKAAQKYIADLQSALSPVAATASDNTGEMDWSKYLNM